MAFATDTDVHARRAFVGDAEKVLCAYLDGREKAYAVRDVMSGLEEAFGDGGRWPAALLEAALATDEENRRYALVTEALDKMAALMQLANRA